MPGITINKAIQSLNQRLGVAAEKKAGKEATAKHQAVKALKRKIAEAAACEDGAGKDGDNKIDQPVRKKTRRMPLPVKRAKAKGKTTCARKSCT